MLSTRSFSSPQLSQDFLGKFHSRKLFIRSSLNRQTITTSPPPYPAESCNLYKNVLVVLLVLICSVIFTFVLNSLIKCTLGCVRLVSSDSRPSSSAGQPINKGIKKNVLKTFPVVNYSAELKLPGLETECVICLSDFKAGERVLIIPKSKHGFHIRCIEKWLRSNASCPKCRHCLIETCEKLVGCSKQDSSSSGTCMPVKETIFSIRPLEPEGIIRSHGRFS